MKNYFSILDIPVNASEHEVRRAYRRLVKIYHPDAGTSEANEERFILITEAYDYLLNSENRRRHAAYISQPRTSMSEASKRRKQDEYEAWVAREQHMAYVRMRMRQKELEEEEFKKTFAYRMMHGINLVYNFIFLIVALAVIIIPIYKYFDQDNLPENQQQNFLTFLMPSLLGVGFLSYSYYYLFILKTDEK
ncbi:MAG: DnaJ domain-containing protein [Flavobacteriales bacterium]